MSGKHSKKEIMKRNDIWWLIHHPLLLLLVLAIGFLVMDPFRLSPVGNIEFRPVHHEIGSYEMVTEVFPRDNSSRLSAGSRMFVDEAFGPECLEFDSLGQGPYAGMADGRIVRWMGGSSGHRGLETFAVVVRNRSEKLCGGIKSTTSKQWMVESICGRPLGLRFDKENGNLYIADAYHGIMVVGPRGGIATPLVTHVEGKPLLFTNDLDIHKNGSIFFTDSSKKYNRMNHLFILIEGDATGRLLRYDPPTKETHVLLEGLGFPNGVQLSEDQTFLLFTETSNCRVMKYWMEGPKAGTKERVMDLPGFPDNIRMNKKGQFWVAVVCCRTRTHQLLSRNPWMKTIYFRLPIPYRFTVMLMTKRVRSLVSLITSNGDVVDVLEDDNGSTIKMVSHVGESNGLLWLGSVVHNHLVSLPYTHHQ